MRVVSNTSPLTNLAAIGQFELLRILFGRLEIPEAVWRELNEGDVRWPGADEVACAGWIERLPVENQNLVKVLRRDLGAGEAEAIALALERVADFVLLDEKDGRRIAKRLSLRPVGVVGILLEAKNKGLIRSLRSTLDVLRTKAGFYLSDAVIELALENAGERE